MATISAMTAAITSNPTPVGTAPFAAVGAAKLLVASPATAASIPPPITYRLGNLPLHPLLGGSAGTIQNPKAPYAKAAKPRTTMVVAAEFAIANELRRLSGAACGDS